MESIKYWQKQLSAGNYKKLNENELFERESKIDKIYQQLTDIDFETLKYIAENPGNPFSWICDHLKIENNIDLRTYNEHDVFDVLKNYKLISNRYIGRNDIWYATNIGKQLLAKKYNANFDNISYGTDYEKTYWYNPVMNRDGSWAYGIPLEPFLNPDDELKSIIGDSLKIEIIRNLGGYKEVKVSGNADDFNKYKMWYHKERGPVYNKIIDYCQKWFDEQKL